jgi:hypothetical protein
LNNSKPKNNKNDLLIKDIINRYKRLDPKDNKFLSISNRRQQSIVCEENFIVVDKDLKMTNYENTTFDENHAPCNLNCNNRLNKSNIKIRGCIHTYCLIY